MQGNQESYQAANTWKEELGKSTGNGGGVNDTVTEHSACFTFLEDRKRARDTRGSVGGNSFFVHKNLPNLSRTNTSDLRSIFFLF